MGKSYKEAIKKEYVMRGSRMCGKYKVFHYFILAVVLIMAGGGFLYGSIQVKIYVKGIFSWEDEVYSPAHSKTFYETLERLQIKEVYQHISNENLYAEETQSFVSEMNQRGIALYYLTGDKEWALEKRGKSMVEQVDKIAQYNKTFKNSGTFKGIIFDVEPYLTEEWDQNADAVMKRYIKNLKLAYKEASEHGLYMIVCIPFWFDKNYEKELIQIIAESSDEVAVMNYGRTNEIRNIQKEIEIARKHKKPINCIFEFQKPGEHQLDEVQTYYHLGVEQAISNFEKLYELYNYNNLKFSYHYYKPITEILQKKK